MVKTELCNFTGYKIYPGHGKRYVRMDSKSFTFLSSKVAAAYMMKRNPRKLLWTVVYRRLHKKGTVEEVNKKKARKTQKFQRAIVGASLQEIKAKRNQKPEVRQAAREAALREIKERKKAKTAEKATKKVETKKAAPAKAKGAGKSKKAAAPKAKPAAKGR
eukprot:CAMPEP_0177645176 /NCGR_PEP_ID=MMETSP0447-20121125/9109_1 /TAXON_ID=0 /ORGANISM="Stygamoeba regulata, Strain BSH-02190019" /LENGTH=160 /DNA_ID=CAMNT_0019147641 /DNA_START=30 /DNA_END=512 /DNA_ORIENTATION=+